MKKQILLILVLAMVLSMVGCHEHHWEAATCESPKICNDCDATEGEPLGHTPGSETITAVDAENLTVTYAVSCSVCGKEMETRQADAWVTPVDGLVPLSADEWFQCLTTNIYRLGATQILVPQNGESEDNALIHGVVSFTGLKAAITFQDAEGTTITTDQGSIRNLAHTIQVDAQFTNDNASEFFKLLMLLVINNNGTLALEDASQLAGQIMSGVTVSDNGYTYDMAITSIADHMVRVEIIAE